MIVRGPERPPSSTHLPNRYGDMKQARVRYGIVCGDDGSIPTMLRSRACRDRVLRDDDLLGRGDGQWFTWWNAVWGWTARSERDLGDAAVNLAEPMRGRRSEADRLRPLERGVPYLGAGYATIAGVPCLILRIGFVGELGYEIHYRPPPAASVGELLSTGEEFGVKPFGSSRSVLRPRRCT
jgi:hypothetical protein